MGRQGSANRAASLTTHPGAAFPNSPSNNRSNATSPTASISASDKAPRASPEFRNAL